MPCPPKDLLQLPGRYPDHVLRPERSRCHHLSGTGIKSFRTGCGLQPLISQLSPYAGTGFLQDRQLRGVTDDAAVFAGNEESGYRYVIGSETEDVRPYSKILKEQFDGRGGGKPVMVQGSVNGSEEAIRKVFE